MKPRILPFRLRASSVVIPRNRLARGPELAEDRVVGFAQRLWTRSSNTPTTLRIAKNKSAERCVGLARLRTMRARPLRVYSTEAAAGVPQVERTPRRNLAVTRTGIPS